MEKVRVTASVGCVDYTWKTKSLIQTGASARDIIRSQDGTKRYLPLRPIRRCSLFKTPLLHQRHQPLLQEG